MSTRPQLLTRRERHRLLRAVRQAHREPTREQYLAVLQWADAIVDDYECLMGVLDGLFSLEISRSGKELGVVYPVYH